MQYDDYDDNRARILVERLVRQGASEREILAAVDDVTGAPPLRLADVPRRLRRLRSRVSLL
jgi:hypothetical protein